MSKGRKRETIGLFFACACPNLKVPRRECGRACAHLDDAPCLEREERCRTVFLGVFSEDALVREKSQAILGPVRESVIRGRPQIQFLRRRSAILFLNAAVFLERFGDATAPHSK